MLKHIYLLGYSGQALPKWLRRLCAGNAWHRAYISGRVFVHFDSGKRLTGLTTPADEPLM